MPSQAGAVVAFNGELLGRLLEAMPEAKPKTFLVPQAVCTSLAPLGAAEAQELRCASRPTSRPCTMGTCYVHMLHAVRTPPCARCVLGMRVRCTCDAVCGAGGGSSSRRTT